MLLMIERWLEHRCGDTICADAHPLYKTWRAYYHLPTWKVEKNSTVRIISRHENYFRISMTIWEGNPSVTHRVSYAELLCSLAWMDMLLNNRWNCRWFQMAWSYCDIVLSLEVSMPVPRVTHQTEAKQTSIKQKQKLDWFMTNSR